MNKEKLIIDLMDRVKQLVFNDEAEHDAIKKKMDMIIRNIFGDDSKYLKDLSMTLFHPMAYPCEDSYARSRWKSGADSLINILTTMLDEIRIFHNLKQQNLDETTFDISNRKIFIVHGHDESMKQTVARVVEKIDFEAIILHEKTNKGRTIIEKFTDYSEVGFAIVLLSGDDKGGAKADPIVLESRARQNVIFEMGFFIGKLGRERVVVLHTAEKDFEMPSDYSGVIYIEYDNKGSWKFDLASELKSCGYELDSNKLL